MRQIAWQLKETLLALEGQMEGFQSSVTSLPRMTTVLNRAKRAMVNVLGQLIDEIRSAQTKASDAEASFMLILNRNN